MVVYFVPPLPLTCAGLFVCSSLGQLGLVVFRGRTTGVMFSPRPWQTGVGFTPQATAGADTNSCGRKRGCFGCTSTYQRRCDSFTTKYDISRFKHLARLFAERLGERRRAQRSHSGIRRSNDLGRIYTRTLGWCKRGRRCFRFCCCHAKR